MSSPSVTPVQALSAVKFAVGFLVARTVVSNHQAQLILEIASVVLPSVFVLADAHLRGERVKLAVELAWQSWQRQIDGAPAAAPAAANGTTQ